MAHIANLIAGSAFIIGAFIGYQIGKYVGRKEAK